MAYIETSLQSVIDEIESLPKGRITYKTIRGKRRMYRQWSEDGIKKSVYVKMDEEEAVKAQIERRLELEKYLRLGRYTEAVLHASGSEKPQYDMRVITGSALSDMYGSVQKFGKRECFGLLERYLNGNSSGKVCLIYGLRRTGKTTLLLQAISQLPVDETAYIKALSSDDMSMLNRDLRRLKEDGIKYVFVDEVTLMKDFIDSASLLSDVYAMMGMKVVLSGTDSLGLMLSTDDELYDRSFTIHTTFIPFREYARLLGKNDIDEYIRYGGTFRVGETDYDDLELMDEGVSFRDDESARRYIDTAIARNIQHSLACYREGGHFRHLISLYEAGELTGAINRIIEDMNHSFLVSVLERDFKSHDFGSAKQMERKRAALNGSESVLDHVNEEMILKRLKDILEIRNKDVRVVKITQAHVEEIREYLGMLDLIVECDSEAIETDEPRDRVLFTQPGMRYCQAQALVFSLMKDDLFKNYPARERGRICDMILEDVRGRMLEDIVLLETMKALPGSKRAFKLEFPAGEIDMVIADDRKYECELYEIKHSDQVDPHQYRHLINDEMCDRVEFKYGTIVNKTVLYRGESASRDGVIYKNVEEYLMELGAGRM
ncbi:AAA family ATPase [Butyrivibrio sp. VCB2001]|uniref:AAA family ATPase n=1 Tax=Butyrivibrio sp. VCB2001 TaxID=1280667 RepID=UPI00040EA8DF|nr:AAA family ATPase [Butyrivibrio sp. VCB2001]